MPTIAILVDRTINRSVGQNFIEVKKRLNETSRSKLDEWVVVNCLRKLSSKYNDRAEYAVDPDVVRDLGAFVEASNERLCRVYMDGQTPFTADLGREPAAAPPSDAAVDQAMRQFESEYNRPSTRVLKLNYATRAYLRNNVSWLHGLLHRAKKLQWRLLRG